MPHQKSTPELSETDYLIATLFNSALGVNDNGMRHKLCLCVTAEEYQQIKESYRRAGNNFTGKILGIKLMIVSIPMPYRHRLGFAHNHGRFG